MKRVIVTTTINYPTEAIIKFQHFEDWYLIVVGDKKTPTGYSLAKGKYLSCDFQEKYDKKLSDLIGWNCIQRRNFGFLYARELGAEIVATVDDDNIPYENWGRELLIGKKVEVNYYTTNLPAFDPLGATNIKHLWHRGYPLSLIVKREYRKKEKKIIVPDIQADFWNGCPDVDAIANLIFNPSDVVFDNNFFPISSNKISPFDSQNTFIKGSILKDYFLFPGIGRMDDIWASFYLQAKGYRVVYCKPSVYQKRNPHDLMIDFYQEFLGYEKNLTLLEDLYRNPESIFNYLPERAKRAFELYRKHFP